MASNALMVLKDKLGGANANLSKVRGALKGTEGAPGAGKSLAAGAATGLLINQIEKRLPRLHEKVPQSVLVAAAAAIGAATTKGDMSRGLCVVAASAAAIAVDDMLEAADDGGANTEEG